jgi:uncharacterized protein YfaP (DUF2135 family)
VSALAVASLGIVASLLAAPVVRIDAPLGGWTTERLVTVTGSAEGAAALGVLVVNGVERPLPLTGGQFSATFALGRGENAIEVIAPSADGKEAPGRARLNLVAQIPRVDLQVLLFWDTDQTDVDLHITEPSGEVVNYTHKESEKSGGRLDRDDTDGYGPEIYTLASAPAGRYEIAAHYFGDRGTGQSTATVVVVAREGTEEELRWRFEVPLTREGEKATLTTIDLPPPGTRIEREPKMRGAAQQKDAPLPKAGN